MADEPQLQQQQGHQLRGIDWRSTFPFTNLFRAFRIAVHPSKLILGLVALLSLYVGGRLLDALWSPRSLAVPGEVYMYQEAVTTGGTNPQFIAARAARRAEIESRYADRLQQLGVVPDRPQAEAAARRADRLDDVKDRIVERRNTAAQGASPETVRQAYAGAYQEYRDAKSVGGVGLFHTFFSYQAQCVNGVIKGVANWNWLGDERSPRGPGVVTSVINFFRIGPMWLMRHHPLYFALFTLWFLTIWAIFGGAISRIAAIHVARDEKLSVRAALAFSLGKFLSFVSAPLIPLGIVLFVGLVPLIGGLLSSIPYVGPVFAILMAAFFALVLAAGFVMTLVLLGTFGGFNLMYPTIAAEGSDSFDAISRSFSYVYARPWRMLFYTVIAIIYGALCYLFVRLFLWLMLSLTHYFVGAGMLSDAPSQSPLWSTIWPGPQATGTLSYDINFLSLPWWHDITASLVAFWVYLVVGMLGAFVISFYFTANTIIYYLMRNEVDATEMDDVYLEQSEEDFTDTTAMPVQTAPAAAVGAVTVDTGATGAGGASSAPVPPASAGGPEVGNASSAPPDATAPPGAPVPPPT